MKVKLLKQLRSEALHNLEFFGGWSGCWETVICGKRYRSSMVCGLKHAFGENEEFIRECILRACKCKRGQEQESYVYIKD